MYAYMYVCMYCVSYSSTVVTITVTDVNDNEPELSEDVYYLTLSEATSVESTHSIALLSYTDDDSGNNGVGQYSITGTSEYIIIAFNVHVICINVTCLLENQ